MGTRQKVVVAMSGGVDSSVAAALLREQGYEVIGVTLKMGAGPGRESQEIEDARRVAEHLRIPHSVLDASEQFRSRVIGPFLEAYAKGLTPNPCVECNREIKFGLLFELVRELGSDLLASGHYADIGGGKAPYLCRPADLKRDQTYFLFDVGKDRLRRIKFPLGRLMKSDVRARARALGLPVAEKAASREICFIEDGKTREYLSRQLAPRPGPIVDMLGRQLGEHKGIHQFTVGQRRGLGIAHGRSATSPEPLHVLALDGAANRVIVGPEKELYSSSCLVEGVNCLMEIRPDEEVQVKIRSGHPGARAVLVPLEEREIRVRFISPQRAVTPGQAAVFYRGSKVLGGGMFRAAERLVPAGAG